MIHMLNGKFQGHQKQQDSRPVCSSVLILLAISVFINYVDRGNLSIAAPMLEGRVANIRHRNWRLLLSAFFWTYSCMQLFPVRLWTA